MDGATSSCVGSVLAGNLPEFGLQISSMNRATAAVPANTPRLPSISTVLNLALPRALATCNEAEHAKSVNLRKTLAFFTQERLVAVTKTEVVSVRVPPDVKAALIAAAEHERRSLASMVEFMVLQYCKGQGIVVSPEVQSMKTRRRD
ncbi:hypothetical protein [Paracidovorax oryzae]|uniref:hypothetical protein n=1 Tax=Paracidovorax oryzae TaxID=862720 RepID=UPI001ADEE1DE|nr:hypothetical protein [Paracidovorax oryzae]